jgi:hypothetical protein
LLARGEKVLAEIREKGALDDSITGELKAAVGQFAETYA